MSNAFSRQVTRIVCAAALALLLGFVAGFAWSTAQLSINVTSPVVFDLSRYGFALCVLLFLFSLLSRVGRNVGLAYLVGLVLGILSQGISGKARPFQETMIFGLLLGLSCIPAAACFLMSLCREARSVEGQGPAAVPRRFGMGTIMVVVSLFAAAFGIAKWMEMHPPILIWLGAFLVTIGGLQMVLQTVPRAVSAVTGAVLLTLTFGVAWWVYDLRAGLPGRLVNTMADVCFLGAHLVKS